MSAETPRRRAQPRDGAPAQAYVATRSVRFSDCDPAGIAYTARLVDMLNGVVEDFFPAVLGVDYHATIRDRKIGLGYAKVDVDFFRPLMMGETADFIVLIDRLGGASAAFEIRAYHDNQPVLTATLVMVTTDLVAHKAIPLPADLRAALQDYEARCA